MHVIVVGAGIIGALTAYRLAHKGARVTVVDAGQVANQASAASFGWINASFYLDEAHFRLRHAAIAAHHRLIADIETTATRWQGALCWENQGAVLDAQYAELHSLGYGVRIVEKDEFEALEPAVTPPERALLFEDEGAADLALLAHDALTAAAKFNCRVLTGLAVTAVETSHGRVTGVRWAGGVLPADKVVLAAGTATPALVAALGIPLPMLARPGLMLRSAPMAPLLAHILVTPEGEVRQDPSGCILAPTAAAHQSDTTERILENPSDLADRRTRELCALLGDSVKWESVAMAARPVPGDNQPVMGAAGPDGLFLSVMHSGATLAPLAAELVASEVLDESLSEIQAQLITPYRPQRFRA